MIALLIVIYVLLVVATIFLLTWVDRKDREKS